jgi:hypothetical protein
MEELVVGDGEFVKRTSLEGEISAALKTVDSRTELLHGPRGSGKTSFIRFALNGRGGVVTIRIGKKTHDEASTMFIKEMSMAFCFFGSQENRKFVIDVFAACPVPPVVVVSLEAKCKGEVLEAVLVMCKILSYDNPSRHASFVIDLSGSRAAIDT